MVSVSPRQQRVAELRREPTTAKPLEKGACGVDAYCSVSKWEAQPHWHSHSQHERIDVAKLLRQVRVFCARAATYADGSILIAVRLPSVAAASITGSPSSASRGANASSFKATDVLLDSVCEFMMKLQDEVATGVIAGKVELISMLYWGKSMPALNALVGTAAYHFPAANTLLLQSLEVEVDAAGVASLRANFDAEHDLVVGAMQPGHAFQLDQAVQPLELSGLTSPWNTPALWNLQQLTNISFALMGDALRFEIDGFGPVGETKRSLDISTRSIASLDTTKQM